MKFVSSVAVALAITAMLPGCAKIMNRKDPVNALTYSIPVGASTNPDTNPLLRPPGLPRQAAQP